MSERVWRGPIRLVQGAVIAMVLASCASVPAPLPSDELRHGQSGRFHVLLGAAARVAEACRGIGLAEPGTVKGCWLPAGDTHWVWAVDDAALADTLAHEVRHTHEGAWH